MLTIRFQSVVVKSSWGQVINLSHNSIQLGEMDGLERANKDPSKQWVGFNGHSVSSGPPDKWIRGISTFFCTSSKQPIVL